jgi:hypothetical protein
MRLITTKEAAVMMGRKTSTLRAWRCKEIGPPFTRLTKQSVMYDERDIIKYVAERRFVPSVHATEVNRYAALQATS